ncbi:MAG: amino acid permease [Bacteroidales bacterium]|nr:amino acid permease [Bacteroidales bacterium]
MNIYGIDPDLNGNILPLSKISGVVNFHLFRKKSIARILQDAHSREGDGTELKKNLTVYDLTGLGIAAVIGAGIFSTIGNAAASGGPAVSLLFLFTAMACGFSALCYARFASVIPISGSAYTYAYASFGELIAWIIGWDLIMEYAIGNIAVAISWSDYFTGFVNGTGLHIPEYLSVDYLSASRGYHTVVNELAKGIPMGSLSDALQESFRAWQNAPVIAGIRIIADIPAFSIVVFISALVYIGIYETKVASNTMVLLKIGILLLIIVVGSFYIDPGNWHPFAPNGLSGVLKGVSGVFFAYIGFDAISTTAEECRNPRRDLPRAIILALVITTVLYITISLVLTGMLHYSELGVGDPLAYAFQKLHLTKLSGVIALSAVVAMASVLLVFQVGQPRIWMSMSRDGLLPKSFSKIHSRYKTPWFSTIIAGILVAIPSLFMNLTEVTDLTSIGTLFAFILVSGGVLVLDGNGRKNEKFPTEKGFNIPYLNSRYFLPLIWIGIFVLLFSWRPPELEKFIPSFIQHPVSSIQHPASSIQYPKSGITTLISQEFPILIFILSAIILTFVGIWKQLSLIPVLGLLTNFYLMAHLGVTNWLRFLIWLSVGLIIYFGYSRRHSRIKMTKDEGRGTKDEGRKTRDEGRRTRDE